MDTKQAPSRQILTVDTNHARLLWEGQTLAGLTLLFHAHFAQGNARNPLPFSLRAIPIKLTGCRPVIPRQPSAVWE